MACNKLFCLFWYILCWVRLNYIIDLLSLSLDKSSANIIYLNWACGLYTLHYFTLIPIFNKLFWLFGIGPYYIYIIFVFFLVRWTVKPRSSLVLSFLNNDVKESWFYTHKNPSITAKSGKFFQKLSIKWYASSKKILSTQGYEYEKSVYLDAISVGCTFSYYQIMLLYINFIVI